VNDLSFMFCAKTNPILDSGTDDYKIVIERTRR